MKTVVVFLLAALMVLPVAFNAAAAEKEAPKTEAQATEGQAQATDKINLNTADAAQLESLPGVGPALAGAIVAYREATPFQSIEDIKKVKGIGDKKFEGFKDMITVE